MVTFIITDFFVIKWNVEINRNNTERHFQPRWRSVKGDESPNEVVNVNEKDRDRHRSGI